MNQTHWAHLRRASLIILASFLATAAYAAKPNVTGRVTDTAGSPLAGVAVSDGISVALTDSLGRYALDSDKSTGYVFVSTPGGYEPPMAGNRPVPHRYFTRAAADAECIDFKLRRRADRPHVMITLADVHLAGRHQDSLQFARRIIPQLNATIADYRSRGFDVYCTTLGDQSWNTYWYWAGRPERFTIMEVLPYFDAVDAPVYQLPGNHDHHPDALTDNEAIALWRNTVGPNYYSYNIGPVHYIALDNIDFRNPTGELPLAQCYNYAVTPEQMAWLKADLATVPHDTPVHLLAHAPFHARPKATAGGGETFGYKNDNLRQVIGLLKDFKDVRIFTGHTHINYAVINKDYPGIKEYNTAAVCANWWWTGDTTMSNGTHMCRDGSVGGWRVTETDGDATRSYFHSAGHGRDHQFRVYDVNASRITAKKFAPNSTNKAIARHIGALAKATPGSRWHERSDSNDIVINVFAYDPEWKVEALEDGRPLKITRENGYDPLHLISVMMPRLNSGQKVTDGARPSLTSHLFRARTSSPDSKVEVRVTDPDGHVSTAIVKRPRPLGPEME